MERWTKYAKRGFYVEKQESGTESNKTFAARISRMATSIALKCSVSKELLHNLEKGMQKLDLEADVSLSKMKEKSDEVPLVSIQCATDPLKGNISFKIPKVIKGPKKKRVTDILEKNTGKKKKSAKKKGTTSIQDFLADFVSNVTCIQFYFLNLFTSYRRYK
jgi:hypothetical protein